MDARVTKQRLGNMLSYDWLKILCAIAAAVAALVILFTIIRPRPARAQTFYVHLYGEFDYGNDYISFEDTLEKILSYDVLDVGVSTFGSDVLDGASYNARRSSGEGTVAIASDYTAEEGETSYFAELAAIGCDSEGSLNMFYHVDEYFAELEQYLARFFGAEWRTAPALNADEVRACFYARNVDGPNNKNRFRSEAQIEEGLQEETKRLETLRSDYLWLLDPAKGGLGTSKLPYVQYTAEVKEKDTVIGTKTYYAAIRIGGLTQIGNLFTYEDKDGNSVHSGLVFLIYNNGESNYDDGTSDGRGDLKYEAVTLLRYLVEHYG